MDQFPKIFCNKLNTTNTRNEKLSQFTTSQADLNHTDWMVGNKLTSQSVPAEIQSTLFCKEETMEGDMGQS